MHASPARIMDAKAHRHTYAHATNETVGACRQQGDVVLAAGDVEGQEHVLTQLREQHIQ